MSSDRVKNRGTTDRDPPPSAAGKNTVAELVPLVYNQLRALSRTYMRGHRDDSSLQPTALVHEAYARLANNDRMVFQGKTHFFAMAAIQMRRVLVEHARRAHAQKRPPRGLQITLDEDVTVVSQPTLDLLAIDEALNNLTSRSARQSRIAELRLFAGLKVDEIADLLHISEKTVKNDWKMARAWLSRELRASPRSTA